MRLVIRILMLLTVFLTMVSTLLSNKWLMSSLDVKPNVEDTSDPAFIFVLSGGYNPGVFPDQDVLVTDSIKRVLHSASVWRRYLDALLVFTGGEYAYQDIRGVDRSVQLMSETARSRGVAASAVLVEPRSHNTREHPVEALTLPGVASSMPIGIVTSSWHVRRAQREFCRYFTQVKIYPVPSEDYSVVWQDFIPDASHLVANTTLLQEWVGLFWYAILGVAQGHTLKC